MSTIYFFLRTLGFLIGLRLDFTTLICDATVYLLNYRIAFSVGEKPGGLNVGTGNVGGTFSLKLDGGLIIVPNSLAEARASGVTCCLVRRLFFLRSAGVCDGIL